MSVFAFFFFSSSGPPRVLHSFPTRRSSDLGPGRRAGAEHAGSRPPGVSAGSLPQPRAVLARVRRAGEVVIDRKSTRLNSSHGYISYAVFCLKKKKSHELARTD